MFTSKGLFSAIDCPYKDKCLLPKCIFAHDAADPVIHTRLPEIAVPTKAEVSLTKFGVDSQQKRRKLDGPTSIARDGRNDRPIPGPHSLGHTQLKTKLRSVSPPAITRPLTSTLSKSGSKTLNSAPKAKTKTVVSEAGKTEELNPRMISKAPASHDIRFKLLKALYEHFVRLNDELAKDADATEEVLVLSPGQLIKKALDLEESTATDKPTIYSNVIKNHILIYKRMSVKEWKAERVAEQAARKPPKKKQEIVLPNKAVEVIDTGLTLDQELALLPRFYTPLEGLSKHGYVTSVPTTNEVAQATQGVEAAKGWEVCDRCKARFQVFPGRREEDGALASGGPCTYHWGKPFFPDKDPLDPKAKREKRFMCCGQSLGDSAGCIQGQSHVFKISEVKRLASILQFEATPENDEGSQKPVCIDGEMCYTVHGLELVRVTATSWPDGDEILDVLVRPVGEILDLNSRWSGVWPEQISSAMPWDTASPSSQMNGGLRIVASPAHARSLLLAHISPSTPIIGHGLENDLNSLRLVHPTIIDTVFLYPHKMGLPYRNALRVLMLQHLGRTIQAQNVQQPVADGARALSDQAASEPSHMGHDSKEDARAAGELVRWKIKLEWESMRRLGWKLEDGHFAAPGVAMGSGGAPTIGSGMLNAAFLEQGSGHSNGGEHETHEKRPGREVGLKAGMKRVSKDISGDDAEEGEVTEE